MRPLFIKKKPAEKNRLRNEMEEAGLDPKKELTKIVLIDLLFLALAVFLYVYERQLVSALSLFLLAFLSDYFLLGNAKRKKKAHQTRLESEFVHIFAYFSIYMRNGIPVYHALEEIIRYASKDMEGYLRELLKAIDADKSVVPFVGFADHFASLEIRQVMISIYRMVDEGGNEAYLRQFSVLFEGLAKQKEEEELEMEKRHLENLTFLPMLDSGLTMLLISLGIAIIIGGGVNGL
jgi:hypothetical protein